MQQIYDVYRTEEKISFKKKDLYTSLDNKIRLFLDDEPEGIGYDKTEYIRLLCELCIKTRQQDPRLYKEFSKLKKNISISKAVQPEICICGYRTKNQYTRHLRSKRHLKYLEQNPEPVKQKTAYVPFKYNLKYNKLDIHFDDMDKIKIFDNEARASWSYGMYKGKLYNMNYICCGIYRSYVDAEVPDECKSIDGTIEYNGEEIIEYLLNDVGKKYAGFSKNIFKQYYYCPKREDIVKSNDLIEILEPKSDLC
jgi:hypothetical protein